MLVANHGLSSLGAYKIATDARLSRFTLNEDETVWIEIQDVPIDDANEANFRRVARPQAEHERRFQKAVEQIRPAVDSVFSALQDINTPKRIELEFGIGFSGKIGAFPASADTSASFKVKLTWENPNPTQTPTA